MIDLDRIRTLPTEALFVLARELDRKGDYESAWIVANAANASVKLRYQTIPAELYINHWLSTDYKSRAGGTDLGDEADLGEDLIFVMGLPRSGTTMLEKILSSHNNIIGRGESIGMPLVVEWVDKKPLNSISNTQIDRLRVLYRKQGMEREHGMFLVDKLPRTILTVGIAHMLFPKARFIHIERSPEDNLMSMYFNHFKEPMAFSYCIDDLRMFHRHCTKCADHYAVVYSREMYTIRYENIVYNFDEEISKLMSFLEIEYNPDCKNFHLNLEASKTASKDQVKKPLYTDSIGIAKNYREFVTF